MVGAARFVRFFVISAVAIVPPFVAWWFAFGLCQNIFHGPFDYLNETAWWMMSLLAAGAAGSASFTAAEMLWRR